MSSLTPRIQLIAKFPESMSSTSELYSTSPNYSCSQFSKRSNPLLLSKATFKFLPLMPLVAHGRNVSPTSEFPSR